MMTSWSYNARWWHPHPKGVVCQLCPHCCVLGAHHKEGLCGLRFWEAGELRTRGFGCVVALQLDPIEKKPLYHFLPGTSTLSMGLNGCNLSCRFCQNWTLSAQPLNSENAVAMSADELVERAIRSGAASLAFTYNEPLIAGEFWLEVASGAHQHGLKTVAVSNGFATPKAAQDFFGQMDAANVDLKAFRDSFYREYCGGALAPVLHSLKEIKALKTCHLEITNLLIPQKNDDAEEIVEMSRWIFNELGAEVPLHFTAFHRAHLAMDWPLEYRTTPQEARRLAMAEGLNYVYTGNLEDPEGSTTFCEQCGFTVAERKGLILSSIALNQGKCPQCGGVIPGVWY